MASEVEFDGWYENGEEIRFERDRVISDDLGSEELRSGLLTSVGQLFGPSTCDAVFSATESPIERLMLYAMARAFFRRTHHIILMGNEDAISIDLGSDDLYKIWCQEKLGAYRVDFLVEYRLLSSQREKRTIQLVIECDGHDFHEKTKEQAQRDKERDRNLKTCGYEVFRFAGSEIWADAEKCAETVLSYFTAKIPSLWKSE